LGGEEEERARYSLTENQGMNVSTLQGGWGGDHAINSLGRREGKKAMTETGLTRGVVSLLQETKGKEKLRR